jgi:hypothetical protein
MMKHLKNLLFVTAAAVFFGGCAKEKSFEIPSGSQSAWEFQEAGKSFKGPVDTGYIETFNAVKYLTVEGRSEDNKDRITLELIGADIKPGTYKTPLCTFTYLRNNDLLYQNDLVAADAFSITIDRVDSAGISGTFNGEVIDSAGAKKVINNGRFAAKFKNTSIVTPPVSSDGKLMLWSNKGCAGSGPIDVFVAGKNGQITTFPATEPTNCGDAGSYTVSLPAGSYVWKAKCGNDSIVGSSSVTVNGCTKAQVDFAAPRNNGQLMLWGKKGCGTGNNGPITVTVAGQNGQITAFTATEPASCGAAGTYTVTLPVGAYTWKAKCGTDSVSGQANVTLNGCAKVEVVFGTTPPPPPPSGDFFPTTANSNWSYKLEGGTPSDTSYQLSTGQTVPIAGNTYSLFKYKYSANDFDSGYFRKGGGRYYEYVQADDVVFPFDNPVGFEYIFLDENVAVGGSWEKTIPGTINGNAIDGKYKTTILAKGASVTVNGTTYQNVIKVNTEVRLGVALFGSIENWYAKDYGLIWFTSQSTGAPTTVFVTRLQVF